MLSKEKNCKINATDHPDRDKKLGKSYHNEDKSQRGLNTRFTQQQVVQPVFVNSERSQHNLYQVGDGLEEVIINKNHNPSKKSDGLENKYY